MPSDASSSSGILRVIAGNDKGKVCTLSPDQTTVGRGTDQTLILADIATSRRHFVIVAENGHYRLNDLGSGNGTLVNGVKQSSLLLKDGDIIEVGSTTLRFEHAFSAAMSPPVAENKTMMAPGDMAPFPPPLADTLPPVPPPASVVTPPRRQSAPMPLVVSSTPHANPNAGLLDTTTKKVVFLGAIGLLIILGGALVVNRLFFNNAAQAQKLFAEGTQAFSDGDYAGAKRAFSEALARDPELPQAAKYLRQCGTEIHARGALKTARGLMTAKRRTDALKALDSIDRSSQAYKQAEDLRRQATPWAVRAYLDEAKELSPDDIEGAQAKIDQALLLDPESEAALAADRELKGLGGEANKKAAVVEPRGPVAPPAAARDNGRKKVAAVAPKTFKEPMNRRITTRVEPPPPATRPAAAEGITDLMSTRAAAPYRARDFTGAAQALRAESRGGNRALESLAAQVSSLANHFSAAEAQKSSNAQGAINEYQQALLIDARLGKGAHGIYLRSQLGRLSRQLAVQSFQQQRYDVAFEAAKGCTRYGTDDGGVLAQLKAKAAELCNRATSLQKSNLNEAKRLWRMVIRMVPSSDPSFQRATQGLSSTVSGAAGGKRSDEDE